MNTETLPLALTKGKFYLPREVIAIIDGFISAAKAYTIYLQRELLPRYATLAFDDFGRLGWSGRTNRVWSVGEPLAFLGPGF